VEGRGKTEAAGGKRGDMAQLTAVRREGHEGRGGAEFSTILIAVSLSGSM